MLDNVAVDRITLLRGSRPALVGSNPFSKNTLIKIIFVSKDFDNDLTMPALKFVRTVREAVTYPGVLGYS